VFEVLFALLPVQPVKQFPGRIAQPEKWRPILIAQVAAVFTDPELVSLARPRKPKQKASWKNAIVESLVLVSVGNHLVGRDLPLVGHPAIHAWGGNAPGEFGGTGQYPGFVP